MPAWADTDVQYSLVPWLVLISSLLDGDALHVNLQTNEKHTLEKRAKLHCIKIMKLKVISKANTTKWGPLLPANDSIKIKFQSLFNRVVFVMRYLSAEVVALYDANYWTRFTSSDAFTRYPSSGKFIFWRKPRPTFVDLTQLLNQLVFIGTAG